MYTLILVDLYTHLQYLHHYTFLLPSLHDAILFLFMIHALTNPDADESPPSNIPCHFLLYTFLN